MVSDSVKVGFENFDRTSPKKEAIVFLGVDQPWRTL